ncbi:FlxA-like family protein [Aquifex pyrophilus]
MRKAFLLSLALFGLGFSQEDLKKEVEKLREEIKVLKEEFRNLRLELVIPEASRQYGGYGPAASKVYQLKKGVSIGGYGELFFIHNPDKEPKTETDLKRVILYFGYSFSEKLKFNSEIEIEHAFVEGGEESGELAIEFAYLDYSFRPEFGIRGGMVLVPVGIINEVHEPPTFFSVDRPYLERNIIPTTWRENGVGVYGDTKLISYRAYVLNGMKAEEGEFKASAPLKKLRQNGGEAAMDSLAFTGRIDIKLPRNLTVGASTFISGVQNEEGDNLGNVYLFSPHVWWQYGGFDIRFVGAYATVSDAENITLELSPSTCAVDKSTCEVFPKRMQGFYLQVAYNVLRHFDTEQELYVFGIFESYDTHASVPSGYEKPEGSELNIYNFGISYKPHPLVALKADYVREDYKDKKDNDVYRAAITWMF